MGRTATVRFHVILTYRSREQEMFEIDIPDGVDENLFLEMILGDCTVDELQDLCKVSAANMEEIPAGKMLFRAERYQYFFNPEVNSDAETAHWTAWKQQLITRLSCEAASH